MQKNYLPSKQFVSRVIIITLVFIVIFLLSKINPNLKARMEAKKAFKGMSVGELVVNDANKNGIADWEESLFGLDPTGDGEENAKIISEKKKEFGTNTTDTENQNLSENDKLSRELFSIITTLNQTGNLNESSIENIANALDEKLNLEPIEDIYVEKDIEKSQVNQKTIEEYYINFGNIALLHKDDEIGGELVYISQALLNDDKKAIEIAVNISDKYDEFAENLMDIKSVPSTIRKTHVELANNYHKTAVAIKRMSLMLEDPVYAMNAVADYKNFSDNIVKNLEEIGNFFERSAIINR